MIFFGEQLGHRADVAASSAHVAIPCHEFRRDQACHHGTLRPGGA